MYKILREELTASVTFSSKTLDNGRHLYRFDYHTGWLMEGVAHMEPKFEIDMYVPGLAQQGTLRVTVWISRSRPEWVWENSVKVSPIPEW